MKTFIRKELPDSIVYNNRTYTFHSAIDREGLEAQQRGEFVVSNGKVQLMKFDNPTDYYYTVKNSPQLCT
jgi:hypothetical protein